MNNEYTQQLILKICSQPRSLDYITKRLNGTDPVTILNVCNELEMQDLLRKQEDLWLVESKAQKDISDLLNPETHLYLKKYMGEADWFKKPHPLDFEWRNTQKGVEYLTQTLLQFNDPGDDILILGMPTLFSSLCKRDIPNKVTIVERNPGVINALKEVSNKNNKVIEADVFKIEPEKVGMYSTVVMDPPWYEAHFFPFIWLAARCLKVGGKLIISIPPINTRPGIDEERIKWFTYCQKQGLCLQNLSAGKLEYAMPFFEWNANRIAGITVNAFWRRGDVATFEKMRNDYENRPNHTESFQEWHEVEIKSCRIRVKITGREESGLEKLVVANLVPNHILGSVSSRNPIRDEANIWTSGNRIYKVNDPKRFLTLLHFYNEHIVDNSEDSKEIFQLIEFISGLENEEYNQYLEWFYFELERET